MTPRIRENRWTVDDIRCLDCDATFGLPTNRIARDVNREAGTGPRILVIYLPETCPTCRNLKPVP